MSQISHTLISDHKAFLGDVKFAVLVYGTSNAYTIVCALGPYCLEGFANYDYLGSFTQFK